TVKSGTGKDSDEDDDENDDDNDEEEETAKDDKETTETGKGGDEVRERGDSENESVDEEEQESRLSEEARRREEEDAKELYRDVNINQGRAFRFEERLRLLETSFNEYRQTNQVAGAVSVIPGIVHQFIDQQLKETVREMEETPLPVYETGADEQKSHHPEWFSQPRKPPSPDRAWNAALPAA
nr:hypothetical protein [Tanacetum cinerariifolium]